MCFIAAAQIPESDIYLFEIKKAGNTVIIKKGENITNRKGYDNQPAFAPDNKSLLYVSVKEDNQADVYAYNLGSKKAKQLTTTRESEYSPIFTTDGKFFTAV
ncbi:MAG TPA: hypothetical protein VGF30_15240, partial [Bacteroidia bacterium]